MTNDDALVLVGNSESLLVLYNGIPRTVVYTDREKLLIYTSDKYQSNTFYRVSRMTSSPWDVLDFLAG